MNSSILSVLNLLLAILIIKKKQDGNLNALTISFALSIILIPICYPVYFMFYTDVASLTYILLFYYLLVDSEK